MKYTCIVVGGISNRKPIEQFINFLKTIKETVEELIKRVRTSFPIVRGIFTHAGGNVGLTRRFTRDLGVEGKDKVTETNSTRGFSLRENRHTGIRKQIVSSSGESTLVQPFFGTLPSPFWINTLQTSQTWTSIDSESKKLTFYTIMLSR